VGTRKNELRFLDVGGLFALLDVLEVAPLLLKRQIIGCLADLMQNRKAAKLFVQWNSQTTMKGALKILLELWSSEQDTAGSISGDGVIRDLDRPLNPTPEEIVPSDSTNATDGVESNLTSSRAAGKLRHAMTFSQNVAMQSTGSLKGSKADGTNSTALRLMSNGTGSVSADSQDARAKIYSILSCVGFECHDALNIMERQQMELVKLYPDCVELETWNKVKESLIARGVKPISADLKWIEDSINERKLQTSWIQTVQQKLADERHSEEQASLHRFYEDIRSRGQFRRTAQKESSRTASSTEGDYAEMHGAEGGEGADGGETE